MMKNCASSWNRADLLRVWEQIKDGDSLDWPDGKKFEYLVIRAFELEGASIRWPYVVSLKGMPGIAEQLDGAIYLHDRAFIVESKNLSEPAAIESLAKFRFRLERRPPGTMGVLFSSSNFSLYTEIFAHFATPMNVLLWERQDLDFALPRAQMVSGLKRKMRYAIEFGRARLTLGEGT